MMHSPVFKIVGAILVALAVLGFLFRGTFGAPPAAAPVPQSPAK